ncbi:hypothetical protein BLS_002987 [Venturia inaequalis]|nr:hypothetical protein BLS_002987 [Venturia inaequalis]KAE9987702.1 hypothetical protein EG328_001935 [Venturia inaequalis]
MSGRKCWTKEKQEDVTYLVSALFAATDVACALLPLLFITKINRPLREKVILFLLMALGLLACACGLVKTVLVRGVLQSTDPIWEGSSVAIWTYSEEYIGIIAANIPCLKSLLEAAFHKLGGHVTNMTKSNSKYSTNDVDSFSPPHYNLSTLTPLDKTYNTYPARIEDGSAGYHASLRETSRLRRLERSSDSQENILVEMKAFRENGHGFEFESIGIEERDMATRQVSTNRGRVDRHDPTR